MPTRHQTLKRVVLHSWTLDTAAQAFLACAKKEKGRSLRCCTNRQFSPSPELSHKAAWSYKEKVSFSFCSFYSKEEPVVEISKIAKSICTTLWSVEYCVFPISVILFFFPISVILNIISWTEYQNSNFIVKFKIVNIQTFRWEIDDPQILWDENKGQNTISYKYNFQINLHIPKQNLRFITQKN